MRAWLGFIAALAACGDGATGVDAAVAADASGGLVTLQYRGDGAIMGWPVFFQNPDSTLALSTETDVTGSANAFMQPGGFVTIVVRRAGTRFLYTHAGVQPGDALTVDEPNAAGAETQFDLRIPSDPDAALYQLETTCGGQQVTPGQATVVLQGCPATTDMLVLSFSNERRYLFRSHVALTQFSTVTLTDVYRPLAATSVTVENLPPQITGVSLTHALVGQTRALFEEFQPLGVNAGRASTTIAMPQPPDGIAMTFVEPHATSGLSNQQVVVWGPASSATTVDYAAVHLREYVELPHYDPATNALAWTETDTGVVPDAALATFEWEPVFGDPARWQILAPRSSAPTLQLPVLPRSELMPQGFIHSPDSLFNFAAGGYYRIRGRLLGSWQPQLTWPIDRPTGRVDYQTYRSFPP